MKEQGVVKFYNETKGYGFITYNNGEVFVHATGLVTKPVKEGAKVEFDIAEGKRGPQAMNVVII
jgi:cold shock protein